MEVRAQLDIMTRTSRLKNPLPNVVVVITDVSVDVGEEPAFSLAVDGCGIVISPDKGRYARGAHPHSQHVLPLSVPR